MRLFLMVVSCALAATYFPISSSVIASDGQSEGTACSMAIPDDWAGWDISVNGQMVGVITNVSDQVFASTKHNWSIAPDRPWSRSLVELARGEHAAAMPVLKTSEREQKFNFLGPVGYVYAHFLENKKANANGQIVVVNDFKVLEGLDDKLSRFNEVIWAENSLRALRIFLAGRTQYMLAPERQYETIVPQDQREGVAMDVFDPLASPLYMMIERQSVCSEDEAVIAYNLQRMRLQIN